MQPTRNGHGGRLRNNMGLWKEKVSQGGGEN